MNQIRNFFSFKTVYSENKTFLVFSIGHKEDINYSQVQMLENDMYREYLLPFQCTKTASTNKIGFDVSGLTSLSEYLKTELTQAQYFEIISGIQRIISFCQKYYLSCGNLVCDPKYMYYHNTTKRILMIYIPLKNPNYVSDSIPGCLKKIHNTARRIIITDGNYMNRYETYLQRYAATGKKKGSTFSPDSLLHFFNENDPSAVNNIPPVPSPETTSDQPGRFSIHQQLIPVMPENTSLPDPEPVSVPVKEPAPQSYSATIVRSRRDKVYLEDQYGHRHEVRNFPYYIGRKQENDLVINENTVSGKHAVITEIDGRYFIKDTSSNGTYLNRTDNLISYTEIYDGCKLYFDRFCYTFSVTKADNDDNESSGTVMVSRRRQTEHHPGIDLPVSFAGSQPDPVQPPVDQPEQVSAKALAYLRRADDRLIRIMSYPFTDQEVPGIRIFTEYTGNRMGIFVENTACNSLVFENTLVARDTKTEIFSGCTLFIDCVKYTFIIEN